MEKALHYLTLLPKLIGIFGYAYVNPRVSMYLKISAIAGITYFFCPLDIVPDIFAPIGLLDDLILSLLIMQKFIHTIPAETLEPMMKRLGIKREELTFDVEDAAKEIYSSAAALWTAVQEGYDKIIEYYSEKKAAKLAFEPEETASVGEDDTASPDSPEG